MLGVHRMATATGKLTAVAIKAAGAGKLADGGWLFLDVRANGSRYWRLKYRHAGKVGATPIAEVSAPDILALLRRSEARGVHETAYRVKQRIGQVFRYAIATGRATRASSADLRGALSPVVSKSRAAVTHPDDVAGLLQAIDTYAGQPATLATLVFVRPGERRHAEWVELDMSRKNSLLHAHSARAGDGRELPAMASRHGSSCPVRRWRDAGTGYAGPLAAIVGCHRRRAGRRDAAGCLA